MFGMYRLRTSELSHKGRPEDVFKMEFTY